MDKDDKPTRFYSKNEENQIAKETGGTRVKNSGATPFAKGDVKVKGAQTLIEAKTPMKWVKSFAVKKEWLDKIQGEALQQGFAYGVVCFEFEPNGKKYYVVSDDFFQTSLSLLVENK